MKGGEMMERMPDSVWLAVWMDIRRKIELIRKFAGRLDRTALINQKKDAQEMIDWMKQNGLSVDSLENELEQIYIPKE